MSFQQYLRIANPGVADPEAFTLLGVSTSRYSSTAGTIGQFGSGSKHAVNLLLRNNLNPIIISGNLKMTFFTKPVMVGGREFNRVCVRYEGRTLDGKSCNRTEDLGYTLEWGVADWDDLCMACREFVSNALDGALEYAESSGAQNAHNLVQVEVVNGARAAKDWTQVYLPLTQETQKFYNELNRRFLHFGRRELLGKRLLPKIVPQEPETTRVYKKGVLVATLGYPSLHDYNLGSELRLDESRNASEWDVKYAIAKSLARADVGELAGVFRELLVRGVLEKRLLESNLPSDYLSDKYTDNPEDLAKRKANWQEAWTRVAGDKGVAASGMAGIAGHLEHKGYTPLAVPPTWLTTLNHYAVPNEQTILTDSERRGETLSTPTPAMTQAVEEVWELLVKHNLTNGKEMPKIVAFTPANPDRVLGKYREGTVYLNTVVNADCPDLRQTVLEELGHHVTGATDFSREFQEFLTRLVVKMMAAE